MKPLQNQIDAVLTARVTTRDMAEREQNEKVRAVYYGYSEALADAAESLKRLMELTEWFGKLWRTK